MKIEEINLGKYGKIPLNSKSFLFALFIIIISIVLIASPLGAQEASNEITYAPFSEVSCDENNVCTTKIYSFEKYFYNESNEWEEIDESWHVCEQGFCTNEYHFNTVAQTNGIVSAFLNNNDYTMQLSNLLNLPLNLEPTIHGSVITYENIIPNVDLRYQYLPRKLKEEIIIKQPLQNLPQDDFDIVFTQSGSADFEIGEGIICDANYYCESMTILAGDGNVEITVPVDFLNNPDVVYPVTIDPTIELNGTDLLWDGVVTKDYPSCGSPPCYARTDTPATLSMGNGVGASTIKGAMDWNISLIADDSDILNATLKLFIENTSNNNILNIRHMVDSSFGYPNNGSGNQDFYDDMEDGTQFGGSRTLSGSNFYFNATLDVNGTNEIKNSLDEDLFNIGLDTSVTKNIDISGRDNSNATRRPILIVVSINETESDAAIEQGINNSLIGPNNPIHTDQQIYLVHWNGAHYYGTYDKTTINNNQTWSFNYVLDGEFFNSIPPLFNILIDWENESLAYEEIVSQVESFINDTVIS